MNLSPPLEIDSAAYAEFSGLWEMGSFNNQRLGQAFYNHFRLHRLNDQVLLQGLYEADGKKARAAINRIFHIN
ncbi:hypothetical protein [Pseudomonas zeae]|uniref:Uncharacterized protein n=1 Tax=Pseudomonas zeae TaxID=2745510 RepID=A0A9E6NKS6_9PSED|nr:hypothetical protein [Pseudomonas zeae]QXI09913.1 hypothetical protein HU754_019020 [Pseudomonas zeae]